MPAASDAQCQHFIREWRLFRGLTQAELADRIGKHRSYLNKIEHGARRYSPTLLASVANILGCSTNDLTSRRPDHTSELEVLIQSLNEGQRSRAIAVIKLIFDLQE